jgi:hypothetical protein
VITTTSNVGLILHATNMCVHICIFIYIYIYMYMHYRYIYIYVYILYIYTTSDTSAVTAAALSDDVDTKKAGNLACFFAPFGGFSSGLFFPSEK